MKPIRVITISTMIIISLIASKGLAQPKGLVVKERRHDKVVVVKNRHRAVVYHPRWAPRVRFYHRWVFFPRYNFYWDNFHSVFVIRTGAVWVTSTTTPKEVENVDLSKAKKVELSEENDAKDSIQDKNDDHQKTYRAE